MELGNHEFWYVFSLIVCWGFFRSGRLYALFFIIPIRRFQNICTKAYPVRPFQLHDLFVVSLIWHTYNWWAAHLNNNEWNIITLITVNAVITDALQIQVRGLYHKVYTKPSYHSTPLSSIILKITFMLNAMPHFVRNIIQLKLAIQSVKL
jgi:hypothetical protein